MCKFNEGVAGLGGSAVSGVEGVEQQAPLTPLWGACAQCPGGGEVRAEFDCLRTVLGRSLIHDQVCGENPRSDSLLTRMSGMIILNAELLSMMFKVAQHRVECDGYSSSVSLFTP